MLQTKTGQFSLIFLNPKHFRFACCQATHKLTACVWNDLLWNVTNIKSLAMQTVKCPGAVKLNISTK